MESGVTVRASATRDAEVRDNDISGAVVETEFAVGAEVTGVKLETASALSLSFKVPAALPEHVHGKFRAGMTRC